MHYFIISWNNFQLFISFLIHFRVMRGCQSERWGHHGHQYIRKTSTDQLHSIYNVKSPDNLTHVSLDCGRQNGEPGRIPRRHGNPYLTFFSFKFISILLFYIIWIMHIIELTSNYLIIIILFQHYVISYFSPVQAAE